MSCLNGACVLPMDAKTDQRYSSACRGEQVTPRQGRAWMVVWKGLSSQSWFPGNQPGKGDRREFGAQENSALRARAEAALVCK